MATRFGRYDLVRPLGRGGMAEVFLALQRGPAGYEKRLVIKRILPERARDPALLRRFFEEARVHAGLSHGNLVPIFDFGRVGNEYFLALELVDGCDLARALDGAPQGRLSAELCAYVGAELCHALAHVHRQGLVHRDVTPRNVLLSREGEVKLADFGVALGAAGRAAMAGTAGYMAPEQARGDEVDARADLYALGAVLAHAAGAEPDATLREIVARAMAAEPGDRFADASAMAEALEAALARLGGARVVCARSLAGLVRAQAIDLSSTPDGPMAPARPAPGTYYRDHTTAASLVDEIVAAPPKRRTAWALAIATALVAGGVGAAVRFTHHEPTSPPSMAARRVPPRLVTTTTPPPPAPAPVVTPSRPPVAPPTLGAVEIVCQPWCVVAVDGARRGDDGRLHRLRLPVGHHRVTATRLDDHQARSILVGDEAQSLQFVFE